MVVAYFDTYIKIDFRWGKSNFTSNSFQTILKEVNLPLVEHFTCQNLLRNTRLGRSFLLDPLSFICAGGEFNRDACTGDGKNF